MNALINYIRNHPEWRVELSEAPYHLVIKGDGPYTIFSYNQIKSDFSLPEVKVARGIILYISETYAGYTRSCQAEVVCQAYDKFFNYGEKNAAPIDWSSARVQEKIDGSIIKVWKDTGVSRSPEWHVSTNGMIDAFSCDLQVPTKDCATFGELFMMAATMTTGKSWEGFLNSLNPYYTWIFELVSPYNRVVVPYKEPRIYLTGCRSNISHEEIDVHTLNMGIPLPRIYNFGSLDDILENIKVLPFDQEGYVVVDKNWNRVKIKSLQYLLCHRLKGESFSNKRAIELALIGEESEFLSYFPEYKPIVDRAFSAINSIRKYLSEKIADVDSRNFTSQKEFALYVKDWKFSGFFFGRRSGKVKDIESYIRDLDYKEIEKRMY